MFDHGASKRSTFLAVLATLALAACGGGGGGGGGNPGGVATGAALLKGAVQSTQGGLTVNGVVFTTAGAKLTTSDDPAPVTLASDDVARHVHQGMVVSVRGELEDETHGKATEIEFHDLLEGEIERHGAGELEIHGVHVSLDDSSTGLDRRNGASKPEDFPDGTRVAVSGHEDGHGGIRATLVRERDASPEAEVRAYIVAIAGSVLSLSFSPAGPVAVKVDVAAISPPPAFPVGTLVEVRTTGVAGAGGVFTATAIHAEDELERHAEDEVSVEGTITSGDSSRFEVGGITVVTAATTVVEGGTLADVVVGAELEAEGTIQADGTLLARKIQLRPSVRVEAKADAVDPAAGTLTTMGFTVHVTPATELKDVAALSSLALGTLIQVRAIPRADGGLDALRLELQSGGGGGGGGSGGADRAFLRGLVTAKTPTTGLTIVGLAVDVSAASLGGTATFASTQAFFDAITPGQTVVKVRWRPYPASFAAPVDEMEIDAD